MKPGSRAQWLAFVLAALLVFGCNFTTPATPIPPVLDLNGLNTSVAGTFSAQQTLSAINATPTPIPPSPTSTREPTVEPSPTPTWTPSPTVVQPSPAALPSETPTLAVTTTGTPASQAGGGSSNPPGGGGAASDPCLAAQFIEDVTIPDGKDVLSGRPFTKTWRVKNTGTCTWTTKFSLVFVRGDQMSGPSSVELTSRVNPGDTADISVNLIAPVNGGSYRGDWMLADDDGKRFGTGSRGTNTMWVSIDVDEQDDGMIFSFVEAYCSAAWTNETSVLKCPGKIGDDSGFVLLIGNPDLESRRENEPALWVHPEQIKNGWISGEYPAVQIKNGDRFLADIGCLDIEDDDDEACDVIFQLNYRINGGKIKNLGEWHEVFDGKTTRLDVNLSALAGKSVQFILTVLSNGGFSEDNAFWLMPQIKR